MTKRRTKTIKIPHHIQNVIGGVAGSSGTFSSLMDSLEQQSARITGNEPTVWNPENLRSKK